MREFNNLPNYDTIYANPSFLTISRTVISERQSEKLFCSFEKSFKHNKPNGLISDHAKKNIKRCIDWMYASTQYQSYQKAGTKEKIPYKLVFITLTLPSEQMHDDNYIKRNILGRTLEDLQSKCGLTEYFWRAEKQMNGNIHFHIISTKFIHWFLIRQYWNRHCKKEGYIKAFQEKQNRKYKNGFVSEHKDTSSDAYKKEETAYYKGLSENWTNPNSTDIKQIDNIKKCKSYVAKYLTKNSNDLSGMTEAEQNKLKVKGRLWYCSEKFLKLKNFIVPETDEIRKDIYTILDKFCKKVIDNDFYCVLCISWYDMKKLRLYGLFNWFSERVKCQFSTC